MCAHMAAWNISSIQTPLCCVTHFRLYLTDEDFLTIVTPACFPLCWPWVPNILTPAFPTISAPRRHVPGHRPYLCSLSCFRWLINDCWVRQSTSPFCFSLRKLQLQGRITSITLRGEGHQFFVGTEESHIYRVNFTDFKETLIVTCHFEAVQDIVFPL